MNKDNKLDEVRLSLLNDREKRSEFISKQLNIGNVITVKANYPTLDKNNYLTWSIINIFEKEVNLLLSSNKFNVIEKSVLDGFDGRSIIYTIDKDVDASYLKNQLVGIEENHELGRFIDLDVYDYENKKTISRGSLRKCILCDNDAIKCMRENRHDPNEIIDRIEILFRKYLSIEVKKIISFATMLELNLKYKFGLVTPFHSHKDMDINMMQRASNVLIYPFLEMFDLGFEIDNLEDLNYQLHLEGKRSEYLMYKETGGVNCYKGLIFLLGMFLGGLGYSIKNQLKLTDVLIELNKNALNDFNDESIDTFGVKAYKEYGFTGARGEAHNGFINVFKHVDDLKDLSDNELYKLLINIVRDVDDTVLLKRSGSIEKYKYYKDLISNIDYKDLDKIQEVTLECERNNISIGGCADIFIITIFFNLFKKIIDINL